MFRNYFRTTFRHALKNKVNFLFKLGGLTLSLFSLVVIAIYLSFQWSFDRYHHDYQNIYRVNSIRDEDGKLAPYATVPKPLGPALKTAFPEIVAFTRVGLGGTGDIKYNDNLVRSAANLVDADSSIFEVLSFNFVRGNKHALHRPGSIVLTQSLSGKIFGGEDPMGKVIALGNRRFEVTAVIQDIPANSHLYIDAMMNLAALQESYRPESGPWEISWDGSVSLYIRLASAADPAEFGNKVMPFIKKNLLRTEEGSEKQFSVFLQPITDIYLGSSMQMGFMTGKVGSALYFYVFSLLGLFLIIISSINYVNLSIADFDSRTKEMGVRKILGARKRQIGIQVFMDTVFICLLALLISIGFVYSVFPKIANLLNSDLQFKMLWDGKVMVLVALIILCLITLSSAYPAFRLSSQKPLQDMKLGQGFGLRGRILLLTQFSISVICICATAVVGKQLRLVSETDLGYDRNNLMYLIMPGQYPPEKVSVLKNEISKLAGVESASYTWYPMTSVYFKDWYDVEMDAKMTKVLLNEMFVDHDFLRTMNIKLKGGRNFDINNPTDARTAFIVNETAAQEFGWKDPIGKRIKLRGADEKGVTWEGTVVGVVKDFNTQSLHNKIEPVVLRLPYDSWPGPWLNIRVNGLLSDRLPVILSTYEKLMPGFIADYGIVNESYDNNYRPEAKALAALQFGTAIIIFISAIGIFSISVYMSVKRMKEFGIRKVLGATIRQIAGLHTGYFLRIAILANIIALPVSYWLMKEWLTGFAYKTELSGLMFFEVASILLLLVIVSSGYSAWKAGTMNPIDVIKIR
jgi:putative ABC transport system permease protein